MKDPMFEGELERRCQLVFEEALNTLKQSVNQAVETLRNLLTSDNESVRLRASLNFIRFGLKVREDIELEGRLRSLEVMAEARFLGRKWVSR